MKTSGPVAVDNDLAPAPRFLVIDSRVPEAIRQLLEEADGCLNMSFNVGGAACARRAIRVLLETEGVEGDDFAAGLAALRQKHQAIPPTLFKILESVAAGDQPLEPATLRALIATAKSMVHEVYVLAAERIESLDYLADLFKALKRVEPSVPPKPQPTPFSRTPKP